jgi:glutamate synthase domain-containing protein 2
VRIIQLVADDMGVAGGRFVGDVVQEQHKRLVERGVREEVTLLGSGGIGLAEHVPKAIICGLDVVGLDLPLLVALQGTFQNGSIHLPALEHDWAVQRIVNLAASWRDQLLEILGAMGIREVRRLRGELGRCMFQKDLEREAFHDIAGYPG